VIHAQLLGQADQWNALRLKQRTFKAFHELLRLFTAQVDAACARQAVCNRRLLLRTFDLFTAGIAVARQRRLAKAQVLRGFQTKRASEALLRWVRYTDLRRQRADRYESARAVHTEAVARTAFVRWHRCSEEASVLHTKEAALKQLAQTGLRGRVFREWHQTVVYDVKVRHFRHR
jgi:hypothetical protein